MNTYRPQDRVSPFLRILDRLLPTALIKRRNPLFERLFKRLRWPPSGRMTSRFVPISKVTLLRRYTVIGYLLPFLLIIPFAASISTARYVIWLGALVTAIGLLADIYYAMTAINNIIPQINGGQWELLRLTNMTEADILLANYAAIQVRVWRVMVIETALRVFSGLISVLYFAYVLSINNSSAGAFAILIAAQSLSSTAIYFLEPLWRMRAITLLAMTVATWISEYGTAVIATFAGVVTLLIAELIVNSLLSFALSLFLALSFGSTGLSMGSILGIIMRAVVFAGGLYLFFRAVNAAIFRRLQRVAFRS